MDDLNSADTTPDGQPTVWACTWQADTDVAVRRFPRPADLITAAGQALAQRQDTGPADRVWIAITETETTRLAPELRDVLARLARDGSRVGLIVEVHGGPSPAPHPERAATHRP